MPNLCVEYQFINFVSFPYLPVQKKWFATSNLECCLPNPHGNRLCGHGPCTPRFPFHWIHCCWHMLWGTSCSFGANCLRALWPKILWSDLQHTDPQPPAWLLPILGPSCRASIWFSGYQDTWWWQHLCWGPLLQARVYHYGNCMPCWIWVGFVVIVSYPRFVS